MNPTSAIHNIPDFDDFLHTVREILVNQKLQGIDIKKIDTCLNHESTMLCISTWYIKAVQHYRNVSDTMLDTASDIFHDCAECAADNIDNTFDVDNP